MTAAERQQRCRANGKGRHRGGPTAEAKRKILAQYRANCAAALAETQSAELASTSEPAVIPAPQPSMQAPLPTFEWNLSAMAA